MDEMEELKKNWHLDSGIVPERFDQIRERVTSRSQRMRRKIFQGDMLETAAAVVVVFFFGMILLRSNHWIFLIGNLIIVSAACSFPFVLWWARRRSKSSASFVDELDVEIEFLNRRILILRHLTWWYLAPLYLGLVLFAVGAVDPRRQDWLGHLILIAVLSFCTLLFVWIWWINRHGCRTFLHPLVQYYTSLRESLQSGVASEDRMPSPPIDFFADKRKITISRRSKIIGVTLVAITFVGVVVAGVLIRKSFDDRTGWFIIATAPVAGLLVLMMTSAWRSTSQESPHTTIRTQPNVDDQTN